MFTRQTEIYTERLQETPRAKAYMSGTTECQPQTGSGILQESDSKPENECHSESF